jgi:allophanate hydrolase
MNLPQILSARVLRAIYESRQATPLDVVAELLKRIDVHPDKAIWTWLAPAESVRRQAAELTRRVDEIANLPLYGLPFGVKDNIHVAGVPTTCGCPGYKRIPQVGAFAVNKAIAAGAIFFGKHSLDQFATGLNGTRTLGAHCKNTFDPEVIPGGSSSGSGVAVASGLVCFSLGSDTGGSGRVPAAMNNIVGLRPTMGLVSSSGMVYNNRLFDCMPVFAPCVEDVFLVLESIAGYDEADPIGRHNADEIRLDHEPIETFSFAVPAKLECFGDSIAAVEFERAVDRIRDLGGREIRIEMDIFREAGQLVFESALVAERFASYGEVLHEHPQDLVPAVATILQRAERYSASESFKAQYKMSELRRKFLKQFEGTDFLVTPTVPRVYSVREMLAEPLLRNAEVGYYTLGVGPLDLCALAVPASIRPDGVPFGISLVARSAQDAKLRALGGRFEKSVSLPPGVEAKP